MNLKKLFLDFKIKPFVKLTKSVPNSADLLKELDFYKKTPKSSKRDTIRNLSNFGPNFTKSHQSEKIISKSAKSPKVQIDLNMITHNSELHLKLNIEIN